MMIWNLFNDSEFSRASISQITELIAHYLNFTEGSSYAKTLLDIPTPENFQILES